MRTMDVMMIAAGTPSRPASQPHWKTATVAPKLAAMDSRQVMAAPGVIDLPVSDRQRTLIDFEEMLARVLHDRYALPDTDQVTAAVWSRASIGAIRTALGVLTGSRTADGLPKGAFADAIRVCFATLSGTWPPASVAAGTQDC
jgi:hypothetical protein